MYNTIPTNRMGKHQRKVFIYLFPSIVPLNFAFCEFLHASTFKCKFSEFSVCSYLFFPLDLVLSSRGGHQPDASFNLEYFFSLFLTFLLTILDKIVFFFFSYFSHFSISVVVFFYYFIRLMLSDVKF